MLNIRPTLMACRDLLLACRSRRRYAERCELRTLLSNGFVECSSAKKARESVGPIAVENRLPRPVNDAG